MVDLPNLIKNYVGCATKTCEFVEVLVANDSIIVNAADTTLSIIPVGYPTGINIGLSYDNLVNSGFNTNALVNDYNIYNKLIGLWNCYEMMSTTLPVEAVVDDLRSFTEYEDLIAMKASEGGGFYKIAGDNLYQNYLLPVFTGLPSLSKQDKASITVKRIDRTLLLMEYHIYKKKINKTFTLFFRTIDMNRKLVDERFMW